MPKLFNEKRRIVATYHAEKSRYPQAKRVKLDPYFTPYAKISLKQIKDLKISAKL